MFGGMFGTDRFSGDRMRQARFALGFTQARLAAELGTRERNIVRWENGQHLPRAEHVAALARVTGRNIAFFFGSDDDAAAGDDDDDEDSALTLDELLRRHIEQMVRDAFDHQKTEKALK